MSSPTSQPAELRLVLLGRTGGGKTATANVILGLDTEDLAFISECQKSRGDVAGRKVALVETPDWFSSGCSQEEVRTHISSFVALSTPGPHALLLCVPVDQPADSEAKALDALERLFGNSAVNRHSLILFTFTDELEDGQQLEEYLSSQRKDLLELVGRCGDRYHTLRRGEGEVEQRKAVVDLLEKVEQMVQESGTEHFTCPLYQEAEAKVREKQVELVRRKGEGRQGGESEDAPSTGSCLEDDFGEKELEEVRDEAEKRVNKLNVDVDDITQSTSLTPSSCPPPSFLWGLWEKMTGWLWRLPKLVRREALFGALVGLFVGGPFGGMLGATMGSVATEVGRRKTQKTK